MTRVDSGGLAMRAWWLVVTLMLFTASLGAEVGEIEPLGNAERGRLVFAPCRTCHYPEAAMGHNNGPSLYRIFGSVAGEQPGFKYYSEAFKAAKFVWTPQLMYRWLEAPMEMFPDSSMMSLGVPNEQARADLIAYLLKASAADPPADAARLYKNLARDNNRAAVAE